eukprot:1598878-Rhodomonas_salina.2
MDCQGRADIPCTVLADQVQPSLRFIESRSPQGGENQTCHNRTDERDSLQVETATAAAPCSTLAMTTGRQGYLKAILVALFIFND